MLVALALRCARRGAGVPSGRDDPERESGTDQNRQRDLASGDQPDQSRDERDHAERARDHTEDPQLPRPLRGVYLAGTPAAPVSVLGSDAGNNECRSSRDQNA